MGPSGLLLFLFFLSLSMGSALFPISLPMGAIKLPVGLGPLPNICSPPPASGPYYNPQLRQCQNFYYCGGNSNNFMTQEECERAYSLSTPIRSDSCPPPSAFLVQSCGEFCFSDGNCPGDQRCCETGCGHQCHLPVGAIRGYCPRRSPLDRRSLLCRTSCQRDADCALASPGRKCCRYGCVQSGVAPVEEHPGACRKMPILQIFAPCNDNCMDDRQCPPEEKCCFDGCRLSCLAPEPRLQCHLPAQPGPCPAVHQWYFYRQTDGRCQLFFYGCLGNANNFRSRSECQTACGRSQPDPILE